MLDLNTQMDELSKFVWAYLPNILAAILILFIGLWLIKKLSRSVGRMLERSGISEELLPFLKSVVSIGLKILLFLMIAGIIGVETASIAAGLAAISFAIGMGLQGSLGHFAAGILILFFKPYRVGDYIKVGDEEGFVLEIQLLNTVINTLNNRQVIIPNGMAISDMIVNSSKNETVRLEFYTFMPYNENLERVRAAVVGELGALPNVLSEPTPFVGIHEFESHSIKLIVRLFCKIEDYEDLYYKATEIVKASLGRNNVKVAYSEDMVLGDIAE